MRNYSIFDDAELSLATSPDRPLVLISANNGGGKTSTLSAFRLALHGRRAFDVPMGEKEYLAAMMSRFHNERLDRPCELELDFDYLDLNKTRSVRLRRQWRFLSKRLSESLVVEVDGATLSMGEADDLLSSIVPPEVARYFFFDAERIKELADWDTDDEAQLFEAVSDLLGIQLLEQLHRDLKKLVEGAPTAQLSSRDLSQQIDVAIKDADDARTRLKEERSSARRIRGRYDRAVAQIRRLGGILADELAKKREQLAAAQAERDALIEEAQRAAHDILPLICGKSLRSTLGSELARRRTLDDREVVKDFLLSNHDAIDVQLRARGLSANNRRDAFAVLDDLVHGKPVALGFTLPSLSRTEEAWMQRVIERELPALETRIKAVYHRLRELEEEIRSLETSIKSVPKGDPKGEAALAELEFSQRQLLEHEARLLQYDRDASSAETVLQGLQKQERLQKVADFQAGRLRIRDQMLASALSAIPDLQSRVQQSKELRFAEFLLKALQQLWNKQERVTKVTVGFQDRVIELSSAAGPISKRDLSSGEKQLFATAFIYALAKLSGKHMPFVIDTPLGRLDQAHRRRFVAGFLPEASHQTILLSTDTEIVGPLYNDIQPFIAHHYDLSKFNGGLTEPVQLALA